MAGGSEGRARERLGADFESEIGQLRSQRARARVRRLALLEIAWLVVWFAVGAFVANRVGFVPNDAKTITYLLLAALVFSAWWQWHTVRSAPENSDPVTEMSYILTTVCVIALIAATLWIAADISSNSMHFALAVDIGSGAWFGTTVLLMTPGGTVKDAVFDTAARRTYLVVFIFLLLLIITTTVYVSWVADLFDDSELNNTNRTPGEFINP